MSASEIQKTRIINELRGFIRKLLQDPKILEQSLAIARQQLIEGSSPAVMARIANEISDTTSVHIPEDPAEHSEADKLFLELLKSLYSRGLVQRFGALLRLQQVIDSGVPFSYSSHKLIFWIC